MKRGREVRIGVGLLLALALLLRAEATRAQSCFGDCSGQGIVRIADLVLAVKIALGRADVSRCPALGPGPIGVPQLIASINNSLCGCRPCPTRVPTHTATVPPTATRPPSPTRTDTVTLTPSPTPTATPIEERWHEDTIKIVGSSCPNDIVNRLRGGLGSVVDDYIVRRRGDMLEVQGSSGTIYPAVETDGITHFHQEGRDSQGACVVTGYFDIAVDLRRNPTTANYTINLDTMSCPRTVHCRVRVTARWTRTGPFAAIVRGAQRHCAERALTTISAYVANP